MSTLLNPMKLRVPAERYHREGFSAKDQRGQIGAELGEPASGWVNQRAASVN